MITRAQPFLMEVTDALSSCARSAGFNFGAGTALVTVQHMLYQTVDLFTAIGTIGLKPENIFALGKIYSNSAPIIAALRHMGVTVIESTFPKPGEFDQTFEHDVKRLWDTVRDSVVQRGIKRIIVLDDGGQCIINIPTDLLSHYDVAGVEQTSLGMFLFEKNPPPFPVFSWARTAVKLQIGGHIFSQCLIEKVETEFLEGGWLAGAEIGIVGLGSVGGGLADIASKQGNSVVFYDPAPDLKVPEYLRGRVTRVDSLEELMLGCDYVFGTSGRNPFEGKWPMAHRPGIRLFSGSGSDQEFRPIIRYLQQRPTFNVADCTWNITSEDGPSGPIRIAYLGFPYNFVSREEVAVPTHIVQIETGGLLAGMIQARSYLKLVEEGHDPYSGIQRIAPEAQSFIYDVWLWSMKYRGINIRELYGYDPALFAATQRHNWFAENTQPRLNGGAAAGNRVEEKIRSIVAPCCQPAL